MKQKLVEMLGLKPSPGQAEVSDEQVVLSVEDLQVQVHAQQRSDEYEKSINALINETFGALNRDTAKQVMADRARANCASASK